MRLPKLRGLALTAYEFRFDSQTQKLSRMAEPEIKVITVPGKKFT